MRNVALFKINEKFQVKPIGIDQDILNSFSRINLNVIKNKIVLTGTNGLMIIPESYQLKKPNGQSLISSLIINNKKIYDGSPKINFLNEQFKVQNIFNYDQNQINFKISNSDYVNELKNKYRFKLVGLDDTFSDYSYNNNITFTNLSHGSYKFIVEGVNANNQNLVPLEYSFTITPPWWETSLFYICEIGFFIILLLLTALSKNTSGSEKIATAMTFIVIIIFFEFLNMMIDPYLIILTGGVPVFDLISKVILGALLLPVENIASKLLDKFSAFINKNKKINQKVRNS